MSLDFDYSSSSSDDESHLSGDGQEFTNFSLATIDHNSLIKPLTRHTNQRQSSTHPQHINNTPSSIKKVTAINIDPYLLKQQSIKSNHQAAISITQKHNDNSNEIKKSEKVSYIHENDDDDDDDGVIDVFNNPWRKYEGEDENREKAINQLKQQSKKRSIKADLESGIIPSDIDIEHHIIENGIKEVSQWYLPCQPEYNTTQSNSQQYIDFEYNTPEYYATITSHCDKYKENKPNTPQKAAELIENDRRNKKRTVDPKKSNNQPNNDISCYDSYHDICLSKVFKLNDKSLFLPSQKQPSKTNSKYPLLEPHVQPTSTFIPYSGQGVAMVRFFPITSNYLLAGSTSGSVKLYSTSQKATSLSSDGVSSKSSQYVTPNDQANGKIFLPTSGGCIREYQGHDKGLSDMQWVDDGARFFTCSLDGWFKLWDTETGKVLYRVQTSRAMGSQATPKSAMADHNTAMIGLGNGVLQSYDMRSQDIAMEYDKMQSSVMVIMQLPKTISYDNFMCAAGDGQVYVYRKNVPSIYQYVTTNNRQMVTRAALHPNNKFIVANTHSNNAVVFHITEEGKLKLNNKKSFTGHTTAGFSLGLAFSPDGHYLVSGDGVGRVMCWNWKNRELVSSTKQHYNATTDVAWGWNQRSLMATCSWDGSIKVWGRREEI